MSQIGSKVPTEYSAAAELASHWRLFLLLFVAFAVWGVVDVRQRGIVDVDRPDRHKTDLTVYTEAGAAFFDGRDPYQVTNIRGWGYIYPPLFAILMSPLSVLGPRGQVLVFYVFSLVLLFGCYYEARKTAAAVWKRALEEGFVPGSCSVWDWAATATAFTLPALNCLQRGQVGLLKLYPLLLGFRWMLFGSSWQRFAGGTILAFPIALKLTPVLPVFCLVAALGVHWLRTPLNRELRALWLQGTGGIVIGSLAWWLLLPAAIVGWDANLRHLDSWVHKVVLKAPDVRSDDFGGDVTSPRNQSFANAAYRMGNWMAYVGGYGPYDRIIDGVDEAVGHMPMDSAEANLAVLAVRMICLGWLGLVTIKLGWRGDPLSLITVFGLACAATLVVSPVSRGHYFVLLGPVCLAVPALLRTGNSSAGLAPGTARFLRMWGNDQPVQKWWSWPQSWPKITQQAVFVSWTPAVLCVLHYLLLEVAGRVGLLGVGLAIWMILASALILRTRGPHDQISPASHSLSGRSAAVPRSKAA